MEIIENTHEAQENFGFGYGASHLIITPEQLEALNNGKCLASNDGEYSTFISLGEVSET